MHHKAPPFGTEDPPKSWPASCWRWLTHVANVRLHQTTDGVLQVDDAALYQSLHRMRARGWITGEWGVSDRGRRARFYRITSRGLERLRAETASWARYTTAVGRVLGIS